MSRGRTYDRSARYGGGDLAGHLQRRRTAARRRRQRLRLAAQLAATAAAVFLVFGVFFGLSVLRGSSMFPNYRDGDLLLLWRLDSQYAPGDVVVFRTADGQEYVKRVVATGGDVVDLDEEGRLLVNGAAVDEPLIFYPTWPIEGQVTYPDPVPDGALFVLGDNRINSQDSRLFGAVPQDQVVGRVIWTLRMG